MGDLDRFGVPAMLLASGQSEGLMQCYDGDTARGLLDFDGQGCIEVNGACTHSMWACVVCGIPTGGSERRCQTHPEAGRMLKSIRERSVHDV